jgi:hypothetical protein
MNEDKEANIYSNIGFGVLLHNEIEAIFNEFTLGAKFEQAYYPHLANVAQALLVEAEMQKDSFAQEFMKKWNAINEQYPWRFEKMYKEEARLRFSAVLFYMRVLGLIKPKEEESDWREEEIEALIKEMK